MIRQVIYKTNDTNSIFDPLIINYVATNTTVATYMLALCCMEETLLVGKFYKLSAKLPLAKLNLANWCMEHALWY